MPTAIYTLTNNRASNGTSYTGVNLGGGKTIYADFNGPALTDVTIHAVRYRWYGRYIGDGGSMTLRMNGVSMSGGLASTGEANGERVIGLSGYSQEAFAQGSGTLTISLDIPGYFRVASWSNVEVDYTINTSDFTLSANEADAGTAIAVYINANSPTVSHRATCSFGTKSESRDIAAGVLSTSFSIPMEWLEEIPDTVRGTATMLLETLSNGNVIGSTSKTFDILCPVGVVPAFDTSCTPLYTVNGVTYPDVTGGYVQGKSGVSARINNATGLYGADVAGYVINVGGYGGAAFYGTKAVLDSGLLLYSGRVNVYFTVKDTRGRTAVKQETLDVAYYAEPVASDFKVWRTDEGGADDDYGVYGRYSAGWQHTALGGQNPLTVTLRCNDYSKVSPPAEDWLMPGQKLSFDILKRYSVTLTLQDAYTTRTFTATLPSANFVMHFGAGGQSIAFGQACRRNEPSVEIAPGKKFYLYDKEITQLFAAKGAESDITALVKATELNATSIAEIRNRMLAHNLLDNSNFLNPINQRGKTSYAINGYTIDRWRTWSAAATVDINAEGITTGGTLYQYLDIDPDATYTAVVCRSNGSIVCRSGTPRAGINWSPITVVVGTNKLVAFTFTAGSYRWAALYPGEYTAQTLPMYVPKGYTAELAECQRYYQQSFDGNTPTKNDVVQVIATSQNYLQTVDFKVPMRIVPTVTLYGYNGGSTGTVTDWSNDADVTGVTVGTTYSGRHRFTANKSNAFVIGRAYGLHYTASADY